MLKRYQVLLNDWLADYIKFTSEKYDWSFSETIRLILCVEILSWAIARYPDKANSEYANPNLVEKLKKYLKSPESMDEEFHKELSKIYFETRKAAEMIMEVEKEKKAK